MTDRDAVRRPPRWRDSAAGAVTCAVLVGVAAACAGENLFTGPVTGNPQLGPQVEITVPQSGASVPAGDSITVTATIESSQDLVSATFSGTFSGGAQAYVPRTAQFLSSVQDTTITYRLAAAGAGTGTAAIVVQVQDLLGQTDADTVAITITP